MELLLVHSPLVGPTTWSWVATALSAAGHDAIVPDLRSSALTGQPLEFVDQAVSSTPSDWSGPLVVGHSGAGFLLPSIADSL
jgi:pimeloyl-ACP methyl ester carboxylesterase